jgi:putative lipoprotein
MPVARLLLLTALLPVFAGCQLLVSPKGEESTELSGQARMQGTLIANGGQWLFSPCDSTRTFRVEDNGGTGIAQEANDLATEPGALFADLRGRFDGNTVEGVPGKLNLQRLYRIERAPGACKDTNFKLTRFHASGQGWEVRANANGMKLVRQGQPDLAVPYVIEQMPAGSSSLSSEANNQRIELWLAPQRCADGARVSFLVGELRIGDQVQRGCAYLGGAQND